jgi:class 3 adenylate cyclase
MVGLNSGNGGFMGFRISFGFKIFGICIFLVGLMGGVAGISIHLVDRVEMRLTHLAHHYTPIADELDAIEHAALEQELSFERLRLFHRVPTLGVDERNEELARFHKFGKELDHRVEGLLVLLKKTLHIELMPEAVKEMHRLEFSLKGIEKEHQDFENHAKRFLTDFKDLNEKAQMSIDKILEEEVEQYAGAIRELRREMSRFNKEAALAAQKDEAQLRQLDISLTALAAILGLIFAALLTRSLLKPIRVLLAAAKEVEQGQLNVQLTSSSKDELGELTDGFQEMVTQLQLKEHIQETFGRFVDPRIVGQLIEQPDGVELAGERRTMTVMFSDIAGFTTISERLSPQDLVSLLNAYLTKMAEPIRANRGVIDKFIGDAILAYWGEPFVPEEEQGLLAARAAIATTDLIQPFQESIPDILGIRDNPPAIDLRIGIATGPVVVGAIGSATSKNYTVMGDTVNIGARLEAACKIYGIRTLVDEPTSSALQDQILIREIDLLQLKGKHKPLRVFELLNTVQAATDAQRAQQEVYSKGLTAYRAQEWDTAAVSFQAALDHEPRDNAARTMLSRIEILRSNPPAQDWDGVWTQQSK